MIRFNYFALFLNIMKPEIAKRVIGIVEPVRKYIEAKGKGLSLPSNVVELEERKYKVDGVRVEHKGGIEYIVGFGVPVLAHHDGTYLIWGIHVNSEGDLVKN